jgi:hypothetical protein
MARSRGWYGSKNIWPLSILVVLRLVLNELCNRKSNYSAVETRVNEQLRLTYCLVLTTYTL